PVVRVLGPAVEQQDRVARGISGFGVVDPEIGKLGVAVLDAFDLGRGGGGHGASIPPIVRVRLATPCRCPEKRCLPRPRLGSWPRRGSVRRELGSLSRSISRRKSVMRWSPGRHRR